MPETTRWVAPGLAEILDRLSIDQIKQIVSPPRDRDASLNESLRIEKDLDGLFLENPRRLNARFIRLSIALAQINLHIWKTKESMRSVPKLFRRNTKLAHQLNGLRNQIKNEIPECQGSGRRAAAATNVGTDKLKGWRTSALEIKPPPPAPARRYDYLLADLIDSLTIFQIKETFFSGAKRLACVRQIERLSHDVDLLLSNEKRIHLSGRLIRLILLLAQANLHVWMSKDRMRVRHSEYGVLLEFAQEMNGIRNFARNQLTRYFHEGAPGSDKATFLDLGGGQWYSRLLEDLREPGRDLRAPPGASLDFESFSHLFGIPVSEIPRKCRSKFSRMNFAYRKINYPEKEEIIQTILKRMDSDDFWVSGQDKKGIWENGWLQNLEEYQKSGDLGALTPKFLGSRKLLRLGRGYVEPEDLGFEFNLIDIYRRCVMEKYLSRVDSIYEFGCGSGQHLPVFSELFPQKKIVGLDWAQSSVELVNQLAADTGWKLEGRLFDMFSPDQGLPMKKNSGVFTMGAMEQLGRDFGPFLKFLLKKKPACVVHIETIQELYHPANLPDYLAIRYGQKRNYLRGYLARLLELEGQGRIKIIKTQRVFFGSLYHDSYSLLVWTVSS